MMDKKTKKLPRTTENLAGKTFGRWTVQSKWKQDKKGAVMWKCLCECGTERFVLARSLKSGSSTSCGCQNREIQRTPDLTGRQFGDLKAVRRVKRENSSAAFWLCECTCGNTEYVTKAPYLLSGKRTHCGCRTRKDTTKKDITGRTFHSLTALYETDRRDHNGSVIWHCRCECGRELDVSYNTLLYSSMISCGCKKQEFNQKLSGYLTHVADTSVDLLRSRNRPVRSATGVRGVYLVRGTYRAEIIFQRTTYRLGTYKTLNEAAKIRKQAEELLHDSFLKFYGNWKAQADANPEWAKENPISVFVRKKGQSDFEVSFLPVLPDVR